VVFLVGIGCMMLIDFLIPHQYFEENTELDPKHKKLYSTGILLALGIAIHNLPEGFAVFISAASNLHLGTALAVAIAAHNIPEGIAVSIPIYYATRSKSKAFTLSLLSGIAEPIGALLGILILGSVLTDTTVNYLFSLVAGIMVFICFDELLPQAFSRKFHKHAISGIFFGIIVMIISLSI
jgi:zinc transporter, ZIP family